jgi:rRNA biogenesis protein RRP5
VKSVEDHGYILDLGIQDISGFLSFKDAQQAPHFSERRLSVGHLLDVCVMKLSSNGRTCNVTINPDSIKSTAVCAAFRIENSCIANALIAYRDL